MKLYEFINKYINTKVDFDKYYGAQCVDLFRQYCSSVLNTPHTGAVDGAKDIYLDFNKMPLEKKYFKQIDNVKEFRYGDVIVWNESKTNKYGHIAIFIGFNGKSAVVFEQDGFKQDGAKISQRSLDNVLGVLRYTGNEII